MRAWLLALATSRVTGARITVEAGGSISLTGGDDGGSSADVTALQAQVTALQAQVDTLTTQLASLETAVAASVQLPTPPSPPSVPVSIKWQMNDPMSCAEVNYIPLPNTAPAGLTLGTGAFTMEAIMTFGAGYENNCCSNIFQTGGSNDPSTFHLWVASGVPTMRFGAHGSTQATGAAIQDPAVPVHIAVVRESTTNLATIYIDGVAGGTVTSALNIAWLATANFGTNPSVCPIGSIQVVQACAGCAYWGFRVSRGVALYTTEFTPPSSVDSCAAGTSSDSDCYIPDWPEQTCTSTGTRGVDATYACTTTSG